MTHGKSRENQQWYEELKHEDGRTFSMHEDNSGGTLALRIKDGKTLHMCLIRLMGVYYQYKPGTLVHRCSIRAKDLA